MMKSILSGEKIEKNIYIFLIKFMRITGLYLLFPFLSLNYSFELNKNVLDYVRK